MNSPHDIVEASALPDADPITAELHQRLHWDAIRAVCRNPHLAHEQRRAKLQFLVAGLARSSALAPAAHA